MQKFLHELKKMDKTHHNGGPFLLQSFFNFSWNKNCYVSSPLKNLLKMLQSKLCFEMFLKFKSLRKTKKCPTKLGTNNI